MLIEMRKAAREKEMMMREIGEWEIREMKMMREIVEEETRERKTSAEEMQ